jgi:hypothetical protein
MKCSLCGFEFNESDAGAACRGCVMSKGCGLVRCPNCGFEMPKEPGWLRALLERKKRKHEDGPDKSR